MKGERCPECNATAQVERSMDMLGKGYRVCGCCRQEYWISIDYPWNIVMVTQEDDCAPDAFEYFEKKFIKLVGMKVHEFKKLAKEKQGFTLSNNELTMTWKLDDWILQYSGDAPWHELHKKDRDLRPTFIGEGI